MKQYPEEEIQRTEKGLFFQTPDVLMMTCALPDGPQMAFLRIGDKTKFDDYKFYGSVRKFGLLAKIKRDKADRNLRTLKGAGLITAKEQEDGRTLYTLNMDGLWELNAAYHEGIPIAPWRNLQEALERVRKIRQQLTLEQKACPKNQTTVSEIPVTSPEKSDRGVRDSGKSVRSFVLEVPPKKEDITENYKREKEEERTNEPAIQFSLSQKEAELREWIKQEKIPCPKDQTRVHEYLKVLTPIASREQLHRYYVDVKKCYQLRDDPKVWLGNLADEQLLHTFLQTEDQWWKRKDIPNDSVVIETDDVQHEEVRIAEPTTDEIPVVLPELPQRQRSRGMNAGAAESLARQVAECYPGLMAGFGEIAPSRYLLYIWYGDRDDQWFALDLVAWWNMTPELQHLIDEAVLYAASMDQSTSEESEEARELALAL